LDAAKHQHPSIADAVATFTRKREKEAQGHHPRLSASAIIGGKIAVNI
jgi:hypothetical protein